MPPLSRPDPLAAHIPTFRHCLDVYILSYVLFYSAVTSINPLSLLLLSSLCALVLLVNALYLHPPAHPPSLVLALLAALLPLYHTRAEALVYRIAFALPMTPWFIVELFIGLALFGNFVRLAIFRPLANARKERRQIAPIPVQAPVSSQLMRQEWQQAAQQQATGQPDQDISGADKKVDATMDSQPASASVTDAHRAAQRALQPHSPVATTTDEAREISRASLGAASSRAAVSVAAAGHDSPRRRKKKLTKSQVLAAQIMRQRDEENAARHAAVQRAQEASRLASESAKAARDARQREREGLQQNVREAAKGVVEAKEALRRKTLEADKARQDRRRAADQLKVTPGEENEKALDEACTEAAKVEMEEQRALDDVNAAQARLIDLRDQLNRFSMRA